MHYNFVELMPIYGITDKFITFFNGNGGVWSFTHCLNLLIYDSYRLSLATKFSVTLNLYN